MTSMDEAMESAEVLKTDGRGRVRTPAQRREAIVDAFEGSGLSGQAFAKRLGIKYPTFANWVQKRRRERGDGGKAPAAKKAREGSTVTFLETVVAAPEEPARAQSSWVELESPEGFKVRLSERGQISLAVACLRALNGTSGRAEF